MTEPTSQQHWLVLSVTSLGVILMGLNTSTLNVALPIVIRGVHADPLAANWILLSYMLVNTVLILIFGRLADIFGRRDLYLFGFAVFVLASLLLGLSPNVAALIVLRMVQGAGAALIITNTTALITDVFPRHLLSEALGINVATVSVAQLIGPPVGGFFAETAGWRWVFWFNVPVGVVAFVWGAMVLRHVPRAATREPMDISGAALVFVGLSGLLLALSEGGIRGWQDTLVIAGAAVFVLSLPAFLALEWKLRFPMIDLRLFRNWTYAMGNLASFLNAVTRNAPVLLIALYLQAARGETAFEAGVQVLPVSVGMLIASPIAGVLSRRYSARLLATTGLAMSGVGLAILSFETTPHAPYALIGLGLALTGLGSGLFLTPNTTAIMTSVDISRRGSANGLRSMLQNAGIVVSTAVSLAIITAALPPHAKSEAYAGTLARLSRGELAAFSQGYRAAFLVMMGACAIAAVASFTRSSEPVTTAAPRTSLPAVEITETVPPA